MLCTGYQARSCADKHCIAHSHSRMRAVAADFAAAAVCPFGPSGPSGPSGKVFRDPTCASAFDRRLSFYLHTGYQAWSFADKPCVAHNHYGMRAVAVGLLSLRYVHFVHQVHQVHQAKCFVTRPAKHMSESAHCGGKAFKKNNTMCFLPDIQDKMPL